MRRLYLVPVEQVTNGITRNGPKYFAWRFDPDPPGISGGVSLMDYGFMPYMLALARNISQADHDALILNNDVYSFPENLDQQIDSGDNLDVFFEAINIPTDWLTAANTYHEFLRQAAAMFQFAQAYHGIAASETGEHHHLFDTVTLDDRYRDMTVLQQRWFDATVAHFGYDPEIINPNRTFRQLLKLVGDAWGNRPFYMGGVAF